MPTQKVKYYHVAPIKVKQSIMTNGLLLNKYSQIFILNTLFTEIYGEKIHVPARVAYTQLFLDEFDLYEISSKAITCELQPDNVGELTASHQFIVNHAIAPQYIKWKGRYSLK